MEVRQDPPAMPRLPPQACRYARLHVILSFDLDHVAVGTLSPRHSSAAGPWRTLLAFSRDVGLHGQCMTTGDARRHSGARSGEFDV